MVSSQAIYDIERLSLSGHSLTPIEIITLNAFAELIENSNDTAQTVSAPRVAWIGDMPIYQPTIQSQIWYNTFAVKWWEGESLSYALAWSCVNSRIQGFFELWENEEDAREEIKLWFKKLGCTWEQLNTSCAYVCGFNYTDDLETVKAGSGCPFTNQVNELIACGLGLSIAEIKAMETSRAYDIINRWSRNMIAANGGDPANVKKSIKNQATTRYFKYLRKVEKRYVNK